MKVIAFTGFKQTGKDTAAEQLISVLSGRKHRVNFADALKEEVARACGVTLAKIAANKSEFRTILQWWGTDFRRKMYGNGYWIVKWLERVDKITPTPDYLICTDVRFLNEASVIRELKGLIIRIERPNVTSDGHASETEQLSIATDFTISNDGSIQQLKEQLKTKLKL